MFRHLTACFCLAGAVLAAGGCLPQPFDAELPADHSPHYTHMPVVSPERGQRHVLVPEACLEAEPTDPTGLGPHLPSGCANALNIQRMAESERDLVKGRKLDPALSAPSTRAAQKYIYGAEGPLGGGVHGPSTETARSGTGN